MKKSVKIKIKDYNILKQHLAEIRKAPPLVIQRTVSDMKKRAPSWIAAEVSNVYKVKKTELKPGKKSLGIIRVKGQRFDNIRIAYEGRVLTPTHFGMTPRVPKPAYTLNVEIIKGQKEKLGKIKRLTKKQRNKLIKNLTREGIRQSNYSPIMLMPTGNTEETGTNYIPFQRQSSRRSDIEAIKTLSLPQMVSNEKVEPNITNVINENLGKRLDHHMKLLEK